MLERSFKFENEECRVIIRLGACGDVGSLLNRTSAKGGQVVVVTDDHVGSLHGKTVVESLRRSGFRTLEHIIPSGEASKNLAEVGKLYEVLTQQAIAKDAVLLALGGGVVSDLGGFVAGTWMRGIRFVICPTTLEADVDACLGGKTAINIPGGKNLVGVVHQPFLIAIDPDCLRTLEPRDVRAGAAESIKHAFLSSEEFVVWHEEHIDAVLTLNPSVIEELITRNLSFKASIVAKDVADRSGARAVLNFGHTLGHGIEECCGFQLRHGECVALGMLAACRLSQGFSVLDARIVDRLTRLLERCGLPTRLSLPVDAEHVLDTLRRDKKIRGGSLGFIALEAIGRPSVRHDVPEAMLRAAFESLRS